MDNEKKTTEKSTYGREIFKKLGDRLLRDVDTIPTTETLALLDAMERAQKLG
jgi:hypothetical protein